MWKLGDILDAIVSQETRQITSQWLGSRSPDIAILSWAFSFAQIFDSVFGEKHLTWKCFSRSCIASGVAFIFISIAILSIAENPFYIGIAFSKTYSSWIVTWFILNFLIDYLSLLETRFAISLLKLPNFKKLAVFIILLDLLLTYLLAVFMFSFTLMLSNIINPISSIFPLDDKNIIDHSLIGFDFLLQSLRTGFYMIPIIWDYLIFTMFTRSYGFFNVIFTSLLYTTFITSIWLWLHLASGSMMKLAFKVDSLTIIINKYFNVVDRPFTLIACASIFIITAIYIMLALFMWIF